MTGQVHAGAPEPTEALSSVVERLRSEVEGLRRAMRNRAVIEQAKGVLVERLNISPDEAFDHLIQMSQRANVKLVEVAATLVGTTAPTPAAPELTDIVDDEVRGRLQRYKRRPGHRGQPVRHARRPPQLEALQSQHQLAAARIAAASSFNEIVMAVVGSTAGWSSPDMAVLALLEPDGALRLVATHGVSPELQSQWARIPPLADLPLVAALQQRALMWTRHAGNTKPLLPGVPHVALPLITADRSVGALGLAWADNPPEPTEPVRHYLAALADSCARAAAALTPVGLSGSTEPAPPEQGGLPLILEALSDPALLLAPVWNGDQISDFRFELTNQAARRLADADQVDLSQATLLSLFPDVGSRILLPECVRVLNTGQSMHLPEVYAGGCGKRPSRTFSVTFTRIWDRVLTVWRMRTNADLLYEQLLEAEQIAHIGSFWWNLRNDELRWSPGLYRLVGRDPRRGPVPLADSAPYIHPDDRPAIMQILNDLLVGGRERTFEFRTSTEPPRRLRVTAQPLRDDRPGTGGSGEKEVYAVRGTVRDVTAERAEQAKLRRAEEALAAQRQRLEAEQRAAESLQQAVLPSLHRSANTNGLIVRGLCRPAKTTGRIAGDWWDVFPLLDGSTAIVVGDVAGAGLTAATTAAQLRSAVRAYAVQGLSPAQVLTQLSQLVCHLEPDRLATLVVAQFDPSERRLRWAAAGQAAPMRYLPDGKARVLSGPLGLPIGAAPDVSYDEATIHLTTGDRLLFYTDGLVSRRDSTPGSGLDILLHAEDYVDPDDIEVLVEHVTDRLGTLPDDDLCVVVARVTR